MRLTIYLFLYSFKLFCPKFSLNFEKEYVNTLCLIVITNTYEKCLYSHSVMSNTVRYIELNIVKSGGTVGNTCCCSIANIVGLVKEL